MEKKDFKILFLDDEIFDHIGPPNPATIAKESIEDAGYTIDVTDKMSEVITAYNEKYYHLYLLDIDMGKVDDDIIKGNGASVGEFLSCMSSTSKIIIYSARGKVDDWIKAANYHFHYYVEKYPETGTGEEHLLSAIDKLFETVKYNPIKIPSLKKPDYSESVLIYYDNCQISRDYFQKKFNQLLFSESIDLLTEMALSENPKLILVALSRLPDNAIDMKNLIDDLDKVMAIQPKPHVIICLGTANAGKKLIEIVNMHPFRIIDTESPQFDNNFNEAVKNAILWYNENEIFEFQKDHKLFSMPMTQQEFESMNEDDLYINDEWYEQEGKND